ncbi:MAG: hypothetical protein ACYTGZ_10465 [Planctomycetota bacterium]|jgi:hypothetical protein
MKRSVKIPLIIFVVLVLCGAGFVASSYWWLDDAAKRAIEVHGSDALGVTVEVDSIRIGVLRGNAQLTTLKVANPPGCQRDKLFTLGTGEIDVTIGSLMEDTIVIPRIELDSLDVNLEPVQKGKYNSEVILENVAKSLESVDERKDDTEKHVRVEYLVIRNIRVHYKTKMWVAVPVLIDKIEMRDIGTKDGGVNMEELSSIITAGIFTGIWQEGAGKLPREIIEGLGKGLKAIGGAALEGVKFVGSAAKGGVEAVGEGLKSVGKGLTDLLGGK